jgi:hypothetical protein
MPRTFAACCLALLAAAPPALAQGREPVRLTLHPMAPSPPVLRYRLLPELLEQTPGNAADLYQKAVPLLKELPPDHEERLGEWEKLPPQELPREEVRRVLGAYGEALGLVEKGARREYCDWGLTERLRKEGIGALLPELGPMRTAARLLALRARLEVAEGRFGEAVRTIRSGLALAKHVGESPTLSMGLTGNSLAATMADEVTWFVRQPKAPNLYWPLADLPRPFLDLRKSLASERVAIAGLLPDVAASARDPNAGPWGEELARKYHRMLLGLEEPGTPARRLRLALRLQKEHEADKEALVASGRPRELVEKMPHVQVAVLRAFVEYDRATDEMLKWQAFPDAEALPHLRQAHARLKARLKKSDAPLGAQLAGLLLPGYHRVFAARAQGDRRFAALRCVEAIRLYAAAHGGRLPPELAAVREVPVPDDPVTGKPFQYRVNGDRATLHAPPPDGETPVRGNTLTYELTLKR